EACIKPSAVADVLTLGGPFDVLMAGPSLSDASSLARLEVIHDELPGMSIVLTQLEPSAAALRDVVRVGACDLLQLPIEEKELQQSLIRAVELAQHHSVGQMQTATAPVAPLPTNRAPGRVYTTSSATGGCGKTFL